MVRTAVWIFVSMITKKNKGKQEKNTQKEWYRCIKIYNVGIWMRTSYAVCVYLFGCVYVYIGWLARTCCCCLRVWSSSFSSSALDASASSRNCATFCTCALYSVILGLMLLAYCCVASTHRQMAPPARLTLSCWKGIRYVHYVAQCHHCWRKPHTQIQDTISSTTWL